MNFKKKMKNFFTLSRKSDGGFTLIELIVVIAVMAILAGAGTAGYSGYIQASNKGNDKVLVGNVMRALETAAYSNTADFAVAGQYSAGLQIPVGFVVLSSDTVTYGDRSGYIVPVSSNEGMHQALVDAMGSDYATAYKLSYDKWEAGTVGGSLLYNASAGMLTDINSTAELMVGLQALINLASRDYENADDLIISVSDHIVETDRDTFLNAWMNASNGAHDQQGFGYRNREDYSAVRLAYNNAFAEYVRANYSGADADTIADGISNYGQSAGQLAYNAASQAAGGGFWGGIAGSGAQELADSLAPNATFPYTANEDAFNDSRFPGYGNQEIRDLYDAWLAGPAMSDAEMFYDMMTTIHADGRNYPAEEYNSFAEWFAAEADSYAASMNSVQSLVNGQNAIVISVYYQNGLMNFDVFSSEADPRND